MRRNEKAVELYFLYRSACSPSSMSGWEKESTCVVEAAETQANISIQDFPQDLKYFFYFIKCVLFYCSEYNRLLDCQHVSLLDCCIKIS